MAQYTSDQDTNYNQSDSSDDDINPAANMEAMAMAAHLEQLQKQQSSPTGTDITPSGRGSGKGNNMPSNITIMSPHGQNGPVTPITINSLPMGMPQMKNSKSAIGPLSSSNSNNSNNSNRKYHHSRHNSGPQSLQPRLSNGSLNSNRSASYNQQQQQMQQIQPIIYSNQPTTPNSYQIHQAHVAAQQAQQQRIFFNTVPPVPQSQQQQQLLQSASRQSDSNLAMPSLDENKDTIHDDIFGLSGQETLTAIWKEIKEIKTKLTEEQDKNNQLQDENRRLRDAVKQRNRKIKELSGGKVTEPLVVSGNGARSSIASLSTDETLPPEKEKDAAFGDWMSSITCSLKARKCNWF